MNKLLAAGFLFLFVVGCGGDDELSPEEACLGQAAVFCDKAFECLDPGDINFESSAACRAEVGADCAGFTNLDICGTGFALDGEAADQCIDGLAGATCDEFLALVAEQITDADIDEACGRACVSTALRVPPAAAAMLQQPVKACFGDE